MFKMLLTEQEAINEARAIINSVLGKRWMIAVWCVEEDEQKNLLRLAGKTSWRFPQGDFEESLRLLREKLEEELKARKPAVPAPLEMAPFLGEEIDLENEESMDKLFRERQGGEE